MQYHREWTCKMMTELHLKSILTPHESHCAVAGQIVPYRATPFDFAVSTAFQCVRVAGGSLHRSRVDSVTRNKSKKEKTDSNRCLSGASADDYLLASACLKAARATCRRVCTKCFRSCPSSLRAVNRSLWCTSCDATVMQPAPSLRVRRCRQQKRSGCVGIVARRAGHCGGSRGTATARGQSGIKESC